MSDEQDCPIDFNTFLLSLSHQVLGEDQQASDEPLQRVLARNTLDILEMLELKTRGNLSGDEERLLQQIMQEVDKHARRASAK